MQKLLPHRRKYTKRVTKQPCFKCLKNDQHESTWQIVKPTKENKSKTGNIKTNATGNELYESSSCQHLKKRLYMLPPNLVSHVLATIPSNC